MAACAAAALAAAGPGPAHLVPRVQPFPQGWCLLRLNPAFRGTGAQLSHPGRVTPRLGLVPASARGVGLGWHGWGVRWEVWGSPGVAAGSGSLQL